MHTIFIAAQFTIAKLWNQQCPSTDEWMKKMLRTEGMAQAVECLSRKQEALNS
jgi:hypothetical protein